MGKLSKSVAAYSVAIMVSTNRDAPKCCLKEVCELDYVGELLRSNCTGCSKQSFRSGIDTRGEECVVLLDSFSRVGPDICTNQLLHKELC